MFIDTHAHLYYPNFEGEIDQVISRAQNAGVKYIIVPGTDLATSKRAIELADEYSSVFAAVGVHPHDTNEWKDSFITTLKEFSTHPKVVAIGEIGLDYYYDFSPKENQLKAFRLQLDLALETSLPIIVHNRESNDDIMSIIREYKDTDLRAQFHCFAGNESDATELIDMGHYISFTGNITFKKAENLIEILKSVKIDRLLLETDSPFMTPVPYRGKRNEPSNVLLVAEKIAEIHNIGIEDVSRITNHNVHKLFGIGEKGEVRFVYQIGESLYINITNRCNADCVFCDRKGEAVVHGYNLKMDKSEEPDAEVYIEEIGDPAKYKEIVFCGYGEPTIRWEVVKEIAKYVKNNHGSTRLNTDGHGNYINKKDITKEFEGLIDVVSISLNSIDPLQYAKLMNVNKEMHKEMLDFAVKAKKYSRVVMTIVGLNEIDTEEAKKFVSNELGVEFRERVYF
ncbi:MAG: YchF/TatD family DNA exonuclease [Melioribacteraceae bacterium]|nr:YchF/TatD family DNA exonuclease [Melioribacteraceae bacterium]